jgi:hypothetical protein
MAVGNVGDLVSDDAREFRFVIDGAHETTGHIDKPAWNREGVDCRIIHHVELPRQVGAFRLGRHTLAQIGHIGIHCCIFVEPDRLLHLFRALLTHLNLLGFRDQRQLTLTGDGVAGTPQGTGRDAGAQPRHNQ